jgi:hypothetical protein
MASILLSWASSCPITSAADAGTPLVIAPQAQIGWPETHTSQNGIDTVSRAEVLILGTHLE